MTMEAAIALAGGILILLSFGGVLFESRLFSTKAAVPPGDRIAGVLVGGALISVAVVSEHEVFSAELWAALGILAVPLIGYAIYLYATRPRRDA